MPSLDPIAPWKQVARHVGIGERYGYPPGNDHISHLGKRKILFKIPFLGDMLIPWRVVKGRIRLGTLDSLLFLDYFLR